MSHPSAAVPVVIYSNTNYYARKTVIVAVVWTNNADSYAISINESLLLEKKLGHANEWYRKRSTPKSIISGWKCGFDVEYGGTVVEFSRRVRGEFEGHVVVVCRCLMR